MKSFGHLALVALGIASVTSLPFTAPLISRTHAFIYHFSGSITPLFVHTTLGFCFYWLLLTVILWLAGRARLIFLSVWTIILIFLPYTLLKGVTLLADRSLPHGLMPYEVAICTVVLPAIAVTVAVLLWYPQAVVLLRSLQHFAESVLRITSFFGLIILVNLLWFGWQARNLNAAQPLHHSTSASTSAPPHARVIWLLLDELSYQQVYGERFPGLSLPAFDSLASQASVFAHVAPVGNRTQFAIPSLFTGFSVDDLNISLSGRLLSMHDSFSHGWKPFDPHQTIFQDALDRGYSTGVAGWYNPYCRILPEVLDHCYWSFEGLDSPGRIVSYKALLSAGDALLSDSSVDFLFLHMPFPHPGGIYNRRTHTVTPNGGSYLDNLALADQYLAHVHELLEQRGQWDSSTILVMGDHSWRTSTVWAASPYWTPEDQLASHGDRFDDRPAYILKLPNQQAGARIDTRFAAKDTRSLLDALIDNRLHTTADLQAWVDEQNP